MNTICSNQSNGWQCIRVEHLEKVYERNTSAHRKKAQNTNATNYSNNSITTSNWCSGADDWGGDEFGSGDVGGGGGGGDGADDDTLFGVTNTISNNQMNNQHLMMTMHQQQLQQPPTLDDNLNEQNGNVVMCNNMGLAKNENRNHQSDDEDESNSMDDPISMFNNLQVIDERNANCGGELQGTLFCCCCRLLCGTN